MGLREIKKQLNEMDKSELIKLVSTMYKKYKYVQEYLDFNLSSNESQLLNEYKEKIQECFYPTRGEQFKFSLAKQLLKDFKKFNPSDFSLADLMLVFVENGVDFTIDYGDINNSFYTSLENIYESALQLICKHEDIEKFRQRALKIVEESSKVGWGFNDAILEIYYDYLG